MPEALRDDRAERFDVTAAETVPDMAPPQEVTVDLERAPRSDDATSLDAFLTRTKHVRRSLAN